MLRSALWLLVLSSLIVWPGSASAFLLPKAFAWHVSVAGTLLVLLTRTAGRLVRLEGPLAWVAVPVVLLSGLLAARYPWIGPGRSLLWEPFLWSGFMGTVLAVGRGAEDPSTRRTIQAALLTAGGIVGAVGILQYAGLDPLGLDRPSIFLADRTWVGAGRMPVSLLGNPNYVGEFLAGLVPVGVVGLARANGLARVGSAVGLTCMGVGLLLAGARGPVLGAAAGIALLGVRLARRRCVTRPPIRWRVVGLVAGGLLMVAGWTGSQIGLWERFLAVRDVNAGSAGARLYWWRVTASLVAERPWLGLGPGRFRIAFAEAQRAALSVEDGRADRRWSNTDQVMTAPHNELLQTLAEGGIIGLALLAWGFGLALRAGLREPHGEGEPLTIGEGAVAGLVGLGVAGLFGFPLHTAAGLCLGGALVGLAVGGAAREPRAVGGRAWVVLLVAALLAVAGNAVLLGRGLAASRVAHQAVSAGLRGEHAAALALFDTARRIDPLEPDIRYNRGVALARTGRVPEAIADLETAMESLPVPRGYRMLADLQQRRGDAEAAEAAFARGLALFPGHIGLAADSVAFLVRRERLAEAVRLADRLVEIHPDSGDGHHLRAHLLVRLGRTAEAIAALRRFLATAAPEDPRRAMNRELLGRLRAGEGAT